jgi:hypothetical protein
MFSFFIGIGLLCCREKVIKIVHALFAAGLGRRVPVFFKATAIGTIIVEAFITVVGVITLFRCWSKVRGERVHASVKSFRYNPLL